MNNDKLKLAAFDIDGTLLEGRSIFHLGRSFGFLKEAEELIYSSLPLYKVSEGLAKLMRGISLEDALEVVKRIPLMNGAEYTIAELRCRGYKLVIITDSYDFVAAYFKRLLKMDATSSNKLLEEDKVFTGELIMPRGCTSEEECNYPSVCKQAALLGFMKQYGVSKKNTIAVGDNKPDLCMLQEAGMGIAFNPKVPELEKADVVIREKDMRRILDYI
ncbi:MAG: HAD-IB family phosphatase [Candidatus Hydrothermarchaeales archaeon]